MLHLIDRAVCEVLKAELPSLIPRDISVTLSFATPSAEQASGPTIRGGMSESGTDRACTVHLLLFDIARNKGLRTGDGATMSAPPPRGPDLWVDGSYHISVTSSGMGAIDAETEHLVLGSVLEALSRHREIPPPFLDPRLQDSPHPVKARVLEGAEVNRGEFWQALSQKPRSFFTYLVTFAIPPAPAPTAAKLVDMFTVELRRRDDT